MRGEDSDGEVSHADLEAHAGGEVSVDNNSVPYAEGEEEIVDNDSPTLFVLEVEAQDVVCDVLNSEEPQVSNALPSDKIIPYVQYGGHNIYKSTLVS